MRDSTRLPAPPPCAQCAQHAAGAADECGQGSAALPSDCPLAREDWAALRARRAKAPEEGHQARRTRA